MPIINEDIVGTPEYKLKSLYEEIKSIDARKQPRNSKERKRCKRAWIAFALSWVVAGYCLWDMQMVGFLMQHDMRWAPLVSMLAFIVLGINAFDEDKSFSESTRTKRDIESDIESLVTEKPFLKSLNDKLKAEYSK